jgi:phosphate starvation-inducible PhoH-like protein
LEITVHVPEGHESIGVLGAAERNLKMIREALGVRVSARDGVIRVSGEAPEVAIARGVLEELARRAARQEGVSREQLLGLISDEAERARRGVRAGPRTAGWDGEINVYAGGLRIKPKTANQQRYVEAIRGHDLVFGVGPAGTGKTYLAVAAAVHMLREQRVTRVILCRPAVEAGEKLGFLPGDLEAKVNPYLRPLLDALHDMMPYQDMRRFMTSDVIEVVPLAFMRGRTLNNAVIILDEAQNTTRSQMKMFLTRMGNGSKVIVTGDTTQIDLPDPTQSGLIDAIRRLRRVPGVALCALTGEDVVRHRMVQRIVEAYGGDESSRAHAEQLRAVLDEAAQDAADAGATPASDNRPDETA